MKFWSSLLYGLRNMAMVDEKLAELMSHMRRQELEQNILYLPEAGVSSQKYCEHDIVVSLTSYGRRINDVAFTIESIMEQTMKANRIILWLSFNETNIPQSLRLLERRGLEIRFCDDIMSYKKLLPTLELCDKDVIITIDDDVFYRYDLLENLIVSHLKNPHCILAHRMHRMTLDNDGNVNRYCEWKKRIKSYTPDFMNFPVGVGGVLYPPDCFDEEVYNRDVYMKECRYADDVWFKAMSIKNGVKALSVFSHDKYGEDYLENISIQSTGLFNDNVNGIARNDEQIKSVFSRYKIDKILKSN